MIKPEDLRIGNWVKFDNRWFQIDSIAEPFPTLKTIEFGISVVDYNNIFGIPLTEKILLDCGCKKRPEGFIGFKIFAGTYLEINISKKRTIIFLEDGSKCVDLKHNGFLHEFQNTIYSLTKTNLIIKL